MAHFTNSKLWTNPADAAQMALFYHTFPEKLGDLTGEQVVNNMEWRVYTEWCMGEGSGTEHRDYRGKGFDSWVRNETHLALERAGFQWDDESRRFNADGDFDATYQATRARVLDAVVKRSVDFLKDCRDYQWVPDGNPDNLRVSLAEYMN
jgi:hypothetical protein